MWEDWRKETRDIRTGGFGYGKMYDKKPGNIFTGYQILKFTYSSVRYMLFCEITFPIKLVGNDI